MFCLRKTSVKLWRRNDYLEQNSVLQGGAEWLREKAGQAAGREGAAGLGDPWCDPMTLCVLCLEEALWGPGR